jgi:acyl transferase domain-containing protein
VTLEKRDIAVIGVSGRYPGADDVQALWENLLTGTDSITQIPEDRWGSGAFSRDSFTAQKGVPGKAYCRWGGFIKGVDQFDPQFFNISPRMAGFIDPNVRLFLETVWNLLEETGYTRESLREVYESRVGVFVGATYQLYSAAAANVAEDTATSLASNSEIANRVSHFFDLRGPSIAIDTMSSSSLTAVDMACQSLLDGECRVAIAGGVNLSVHMRKYVGLSQRQILGSDSGSRSFSAGDGFLPAECVGAVLLKPLSRALEDRDTILAVIKSSATNHSGCSGGTRVADIEAQAQLIEANFRRAGIDPDTLSYVEAGANGSRQGDAQEIRALTRAFRKFTGRRQFCPIGSVASNIGHAEAAAGIAQLTKVILQLQHSQLVPSIRTEPLNPHIDFENSPFFLLRGEPREWSRPLAAADASATDGATPELPRRAAVCSFGAGGANAHLIVEEFRPSEDASGSAAAPGAPVAMQDRSTEIIVLSARTPEALREVARRLCQHVRLKQPGEPGRADRVDELFSLLNIAYTLQACREEMSCRMALLAGDFEELATGLEQFVQDTDTSAEVPIALYRGDLEGNSAIRELLSGGAGAAMLESLLADHRLDKLAMYWVQGGRIPWQRLYAGKCVRKLPLPTYPFSRSTVWLTGRRSDHQQADSAARADSRPAMIDGFREAPEGTVESALAAIWSELLGLNRVGRHQNFFELGGDSRLGMQMIARVRESMGVDLPLRQLFEAATVAQLSAQIKQLGAGAGGWIAGVDATAGAEYERVIL